MSILSQIKSILGYEGAAAEKSLIVIGGQIITGWEEEEIRIGLELMPWTADLALTSYQPATGANVTINPGDEAQLYIGSDLLLTGYVLSVVESEGPSSHGLRVQITAKSIDLTDCSAEFSTYQMNSTNALAIARKVSAFAGIQVASINGAGNIDVQQFSAILTETAYEIIERVCRLACVLFYDQPDGSIALSGVGTGRMSSGFVVGENVEDWTRVRSNLGRYSTVTAILASTVMLFTEPTESNYVTEMEAISSGAKAQDAAINRTRPLLIPVELGDTDQKVAQQRVQWEVNRRYGRANTVMLTCDSWRDKEGNLWLPNKIASFTDPAGVSTDYLIGEIVFRRSRSGTRADVTLAPPSAYQPQPVLNPLLNNELNVALKG
ncbi:phage baseplate assembly protein [Gluconobacter cerinus]|uniref:Tail protein n=1 Tax=Gluconobacter cerinus TaxID=38307 RepID=A0AAV5NBX4_9PROT|nr:phage tail protein [Gluconobacter cerinus]GBR03120.1 bacteriophage tail protein [Gluconobacter cerinus NRIC 0229]GLQ61545.1 tail protein [Gluconobacter cerinus]